MKKITQESVEKFLYGIPYKKQNMEVVREGSIYYLKLFGNKIAARRNSELWISNAGWFTKTTKERLNALPNVNINQRDWNWYLNGNMWDGKPIYVGTI